MKDEERHKLYEKLYFHEVDARDKVVARLQISMAILFSILSVFAILVKAVDIHIVGSLNLWFYGFLGLSVILFLKSFIYFVGAFYNHGYSFMPSPLRMEDYRQELINHYEPYEGSENYVDEEFTKFIYDYFNKCTSANVIVNDLRSYKVHMCNRYLIFTVAPLLVSFLIFTFSDMDGSKKIQKIELNGPVSFEYPKKPLEIRGRIDSNTLEVDFSDEIKEMLHDRQRKENESAATTTSTASD
jgi:hypothetical protein